MSARPVKGLLYHPREGPGYTRPAVAPNGNRWTGILMRTYQYDSNLPGFLHGSLCIAIQVVLAVASACCPGHKPCLIRFNIPALLLRWARDWALCTPSELTPGKVHMWQNCCLIRLSSKVRMHIGVSALCTTMDTMQCTFRFQLCRAPPWKQCMPGYQHCGAPQGTQCTLGLQHCGAPQWTQCTSRFKLCCASQ